MSDAIVTVSQAPSTRKPMLFLGVSAGIALLLIVVLALWIFKFRSNDPNSGAARVSNVTSNANTGAPSITPSTGVGDLMRSEAETKANAALSENTSTTAALPPLMAEQTPAAAVPPPEVRPQAPSKPRQPVRRKPSVDDLLAINSAINNLRVITHANGTHINSLVNVDLVDVAPVASTGNGEEFGVNSLGLKIGQLLTARIDVGINSDYPNQTTATILAPAEQRGLVLVGRVSAGNSGRNNRQPVIEYTTAYRVGRDPVTIKGIAVDPSTRIPVLSGKTNYHVLYNTVFGLGGTFASAYASTLATRTGTQFVGDQQQVVNARIDINPATAGAASALSSLSNSANTDFLPPTITIPAGTVIGVVIIEQSERRNNSASTTAANANLAQPQIMPDSNPANPRFE